MIKYMLPPLINIFYIIKSFKIGVFKMSNNMIMRTQILIVGISAIFMSGCAGGKGKVAASAMEAVEKRALFDMDCEEVSTQPLGDVSVYNNQFAEVSIGATGCGKKASYITRCTPGGWIGEKLDCTPHLNSLTE
jgi:hypothetical protein